VLKDSAAKLRSFYFHVPDYMELCMWKMQILDGRHLLIKYGDSEQAGKHACLVIRSVLRMLLIKRLSAGNRTHDLSGMMAFFVVFDFVDGQIVNVLENNSPEMMRTYKMCTDFFHNLGVHDTADRLSLPSNW
jgi:hypothetical protein